MYYEEKVINGILCYRFSPDAEWKEFTAEKLTMRLLKSEQENNRPKY